MKQNDFLIDEEQINSFIYSSTLAKLNERVERFDAAISTFKEYSLPVDLDFLKSTTSDLALRKYLDQRAEKDIKERGGFLIDQDERAAIISKCVDTYQAVKVASKVIYDAINRPTLPIVVTDDTPSLDRSKVEELARIAATYHVDAASLMEYHKLISEVRSAMARAQAFEDAHGLAHFSNGSATIDFVGTFGSGYAAPHEKVNMQAYFSNFEDSPSNWVMAVGGKFRK